MRPTRPPDDKWRHPRSTTSDVRYNVDMNTHEFTETAMASAGRQLEQVLAGLKEEHSDVKVASVASSARETLEHLVDCYVNTPAAVEGKEPQWGSYTIEDKSLANLLKLCAELRAKAVQKILTAPEDKVGELALNYIILHDAYHVGQLALLRMQTDASWDPYSIYA